MNKITNINFNNSIKAEMQTPEVQKEQTPSVFDELQDVQNAEISAADGDYLKALEKMQEDGSYEIKKPKKSILKYLQKEKEPNVQDLILSQIEEEISKQKSEIETQKDSKTGFGAIADGVKGFFGKGSNGKLNEIEKLEEKYSSLLQNPDIEELNEFYFELFGQMPDVAEIKKAHETAQNLEEGFTLENGQILTKQDVCDMLSEQGEQLEKYFDKSSKSQGIISKTLGFVNNFAGFGTTQNMTKAQIENYQNLIEQLNETKNPEEFASLYKAITGEELTTESLESLIGGESKVENSKACETIMDYETTQETALSSASSVLSGIIFSAAAIASPFTGGASLAIATVAGAGLNVMFKGTDAITRTNGEGVFNNLIDYAKEDLLKDAAQGAVNGLSNGVGNAMGKVVEKKIASSLAGTFLGGKLSSTTIQTGARIAGEFLDGASDGAISNAGEYLIDVAIGDEKFSLKTLKDKTLLGGAMGGAMSVGMQEGIGLIKNFKGSDVLEDSALDNTNKLTKDLDIDDSANKITKDLDIKNKDKVINGFDVEDYESLTVKYTDTAISTKEATDVLNKLVDIGKLPKDIDYLKILNDPTSVSKEFYDDLTKLYSAYTKGIDIEDAFVPKFANYDDALKNIKTGDVCVINGNNKIGIKMSDGTITQLDISAQKYLELFPPVQRYTSMQGNVGDCFLVSSLDLMYKTPETRVNILKSFTERPDGSIVVKVGNSKVSFENINSINNAYRKDTSWINKRTNIDGCNGMKMLEEVFGFDYISKKTQWLSENLKYFEPGSKNYNEYSKQLMDLQDPNKFIGDIALEARAHGGYNREVFEAFGLKDSQFLSLEKGLDILQNKENWDKYIITLCSKGTSDRLFLNEGLKLAGRHAYGAVPYVSNGEIRFKITNPWDCAKHLDMTIEEMKQYFNYIDIAKKA